MKTFLALLLCAAPAVSGAAPLPHKADSVALVWSSGQYRYDAAGNIIAIGTNAYRYDPVGRLVDGTAHTPSYTNRQTFRYDAYGNLERIETTMQRAGATGIAAAVDQLAVSAATNRITDLSRCQAGVNCISGDYDAAGNQIASAAGGTFDYDALGMMTRLRAGLKNEQYVYDADNERIATVAPGQTRYTLRDLGGKVVREATYSASTWSWQKDYVYRDGSLLAAITPTQREHFHLDHLGSPRLITDDAGFKLAAHTYWPFGAEAPGSDADTEQMKFTGHERDFGTGPGLDLDYMHARFYGVVGGRFMAVDPVFGNPAVPQSWNRYAYVGNNPINATDPTGRQTQRGNNPPACPPGTDGCPSALVLKVEVGHEEVLGAPGLFTFKAERKVTFDLANEEVRASVGLKAEVAGQTAGKTSGEQTLWTRKDGFHPRRQGVLKNEFPHEKDAYGRDQSVVSPGLIVKIGSVGVTLTKYEVSLKVPILGPLSVTFGANPVAVTQNVTNTLVTLDTTIKRGYLRMAGWEQYHMWH